MDGAIAVALREAIIADMLRPGTRLSEAQVARRLSVSRTPVRQALVQLEHERLVVMVPHIGASVRAITPQDVKEIYEVRIALEVLAVKLLIRRLTAVGKAQLGEALGALRASAGSLDAYAGALDTFHLAIMRLSGNGTLAQIYESLVGPIRRFRRINLRRRDRVERSLRANARLGRAILELDEAAGEMMGEHLQRACDDIIAILHSSPEEHGRT